jgi:hypothetical protein
MSLLFKRHMTSIVPDWLVWLLLAATLGLNARLRLASPALKPRRQSFRDRSQLH